jgi:hypothetical protein
MLMLQTDSGQDAAKDAQQAREWLLAQRIARDNLSPEQSEALGKKYAELSSPQLRVLVQVFERTYGIKAPFNESLGEVVDPTEQAKEWLVAYRIVSERLTVEEAKQFAEELDQMSASQLRVLVMAYREKRSQAREQAKVETSDDMSQHQRDAQAKMLAAEQRMQAEELRRQLALNRAAGVRNNRAVAARSENRAGAAAAATQNRRFEQQQAFGQRQWSRAQIYNRGGYYGGGYGRPAATLRIY